MHPGVDHASFAVSDTEGSMAFYRDVLEGEESSQSGI
jgi:catechol 2,3-dioxygenase-like lactoylglutathione lyase family enzyme